MAQIIDELRDRLGWALDDEERAAVEVQGVLDALPKRPDGGGARLESIASMAAMAEGGVVLDQLVTRLAVRETYFFREPAHFAFLETVVFPEIVALRRPEHVLRLWSAGCSSGEEAYSLAMTAHRAGLAGRARVLGSDVSREALAKARAAVYPSWSFRGSGAELARPFVSAKGPLEEVVPAIRRMVDFARINLASASYPSPANGTSELDVVLCRNVLIYLDPRSVERTARRLHDALAEGGWLVTASSDPPLGDFAPFETVLTPTGVYYRRGSSEARIAAPPLGREPGAVRAGWEPARRVEARWPERESHTLRGARRRAPARGASRSEPSLARADRSAHGAIAAAASAAPAREVGRTEGTARDGGEEEERVQRVRAVANAEGPDAALRVAAEAVAEQPSSAALRYLHATLLLARGRADEAVAALRAALFLEPDLAVAELLLGMVLETRGDRVGARRAFRRAAASCSARPHDEPVALGEGETAGRLAEIALRKLAACGPEMERVP